MNEPGATETKHPDNVDPDLIEIVAIEILSHCLLMGQGVYDNPRDQALGILKRLKAEGYAVVRKG